LSLGSIEKLADRQKNRAFLAQAVVSYYFLMT